MLLCLCTYNTYFGSFLCADVRTALVGVGLVVKDEKSGMTILDKGELFFSGFVQKQEAH